MRLIQSVWIPRRLDVLEEAQVALRERYALSHRHIRDDHRHVEIRKELNILDRGSAQFSVKAIREPWRRSAKSLGHNVVRSHEDPRPDWEGGSEYLDVREGSRPSKVVQSGIDDW